MSRFSLPLAMLFVASTAHAQLSGGALSGTVLDPSDTLVPGAQITIERPDTHEIRRVVSSSSGFYSATNLPPGTYDITAVMQGFTVLERTGIVVEVGPQWLWICICSSVPRSRKWK
jgi:hypothetical protein